MVQLGRLAVPDDIACIIRSEADRQGCPQYIALGIARAESAFDPNAVGDNGCSIGLFQLNTCGGQGSDYATNPNALKDPKLNAQIAIRPITIAAFGSSQQGLQGEAWIRNVAIYSGHPGRVSPQDPRVTAIFTYCMQLIFNANGTPAVWPPNDPARCSGVIPPPPPLGVWAEPFVPQSRDDAERLALSHFDRVDQLWRAF